MSKALDYACTASKAWISDLEQRSVAATASREQLIARFGGDLPELGMPPEAVIRSLTENAADGLLGSAGGRFFAWVIGGGLESALAADWLVSTWDQNAAVYACSPSAAVIEEVAGTWIKDLLALPSESSFAFTTGCQMAHMTALAAARFAVLDKLGWNVEEQGLFGAPTVRILTNDQKHGSVERAIRFLGFGKNAIINMETDVQGQVTPHVLENALNSHAGPKIVVLNAADLNIAAFDPFLELIPIAHRAGAWVHVDGAFGLFARASEQYRHLLDGVELADSWATDGHKWLNVPFDCGISIIRHQQAHRSAMTLSTSYVESHSSARDQIDWNPEWSRRARGVSVYAALKELGRDGVEDLIDRSCKYCAQLVAGIGALPGAKIVFQPTLNQGLIRFEKAGAGADENDAYTDEIINRINASGVAFFSGTTWRGQRAMRISVVNWRTTAEDVKTAIAAVSSLIS
jgi:glutamate/tyrosine decarboxylase-like PLP-dependent enzyme